MCTAALRSLLIASRLRPIVSHVQSWLPAFVLTMIAGLGCEPVTGADDDGDGGPSLAIFTVSAQAPIPVSHNSTGENFRFDLYAAVAGDWNLLAWQYSSGGTAIVDFEDYTDSDLWGRAGAILLSYQAQPEPGASYEYFCSGITGFSIVAGRSISATLPSPTWYGTANTAEPSARTACLPEP